MRIRTIVGGVWSTRTLPLSAEIYREELENEAGDYLGTIVNVKRRHKGGGSTYGWRPEKAAANSALTSKADAIRKVLNSRCRVCGVVGMHDGWAHDARAFDLPPRSERGAS